MRRVKKSIRQQSIINQDTKKDVIYATIDNVLQPVVYDRTLDNQNIIKQNVYMTPERRLARRVKASNTASVTVGQIQGDTIINPIISFDYSRGFAKVTSGNNIQLWKPSFGNNNLNQTTVANQPDIGLDGRGVNGKYPAYFKRDNSDFMTFDSSVTISGDFTMLFYIEPIADPLHKQYRLLGKSDDNNMYISIGESFNKSYNISFASGSEYEATVSGYWQPSKKDLLITIQRNNDRVIIRENGVQTETGTIPTSDFVFDQFGKIGNLSIPTFNGRFYHFSAFDGYITTELEKLEDSIIKQAELANKVGVKQQDYDFEGDEIVDIEPI